VAALEEVRDRLVTELGVAMPPSAVIRLEYGFDREPDCAIVALAMYLDGVTYADVIRAAAQERDKGREGLTLRAIVRVAARLGHTLRRRKLDPDEGYGLITSPGHAAVLLDGRVLDRLTNWPLDAWLADQRCLLGDCDFYVAVD
jgi:hypothetical protein